MRYELRYAESISEIKLLGRDPKLFRPWSRTSLLARQLTGFRCCYPGCNCEAKSTHHALLRERLRVKQDGVEKLIWVPIAGFEIPGIHVFPLCPRHHDADRSDPESAHNPRHWYGGAEGGARLDARQRSKYYHLLTQGWDEKTQRKQLA